MRNAIRTALKSSANTKDNRSSHNALAAAKTFTDEQGEDGTEETSLDRSALCNNDALLKTHYLVNSDT
jgi:hypothetical protein